MNTATTIISLLGAGAAGYLVYRLFAGKTTDTNSTINNNTMGRNTLSPRGYRNHNPLNIEYKSFNDWKGKVLPNTDGRFEQFVSNEYGYRAAIFLIKKYINAGLRTVSQIISKWAPNSENNTSGYISTVCSITGFTPGEVIYTKDQILELVYAMAIVENGYATLPNRDEIQAGWNLL